MIRGVKHITIILSTIFALITNTSFAQESFTINYTAPIGMQIFNPNKTNNKNIYNTNNVSGASHSIIQEIFKNTNVILRYIPFNNYNETIQYSMKYLSQDNLDLVIGITFDEENLKYLNYIPTPIYTDNIVIVIDKNFIPDDKSLTKNIIETISNLSKTNQLYTLEKFNLHIPNISSINEIDINQIMEKVFNNKTFFITTMDFIKGYINDNQNNPKIKNLKILKYPNNVHYLIALNKNKTQEKINFEKQLYTLEEFINIRLNDLLTENKLENIIKEFKTN
jgi:hypothetical protein